MNTNIQDAAVIIGPLLVLGAILKHAFPAFPNRFIPLVTVLAGTAGYLITTGAYTTQGIFNALLVAVSATGVHSAIKNTVEGLKEDVS